MAIDPNDTNIVFAGTDGGGDLFKSVNGGNTWEKADLPPLVGIIDVILPDPLSNGIDYFAADGIYMSTEGGRWEEKVFGLPERVGTPNLLISKDGILYISANKYENRGVYYSDPYILNWKDVGDEYFEVNIYGLAVSDCGYVYAGARGIHLYAPLEY